MLARTASLRRRPVSASVSSRITWNCRSAPERANGAAGPLDQEGGTLVVDGAGELAEYGKKGSPPVVFGRDPLPLPLAYSWARLNGEPAWPAGEMVVPMLEPGTYTVCRGAPAGTAPAGPAARCTSGVLPPRGRLMLTLPTGD